jgi:dihydrofolate reductase
MKRIGVFNHVSVDGFFAGPKGEIDWFKDIKKDKAYDAFMHQSSGSENTIVMGHTTYEMMKSYWPTPAAIKADPAMAKVMNNSRKIVFSKKMKSAKEGPNWKNITLLNDIKPGEIMKLKKEAGMTILGSGTIVQQFANLGLIDDYMLAVVPVILGKGKPLFGDVNQMNLELGDSKSFKNGMLIQFYTRAKTTKRKKKTK